MTNDDPTGNDAAPQAPEGTWVPFPSSGDDKKRQAEKPRTPQTLSPTYRLAYDDPDFLTA